MTHPFPIEVDVSLDSEGITPDYVLFHNGHWNKWQETLFNRTLSLNVRLPQGRWSDTRAMAYLAAHHGLAVLDFIDEKVVAFAPNAIAMYGSGWHFINNVWCSNKLWEARLPNRIVTMPSHQTTHYPGYYTGNQHQTMCRYGRCTEPKEHLSDFCAEHDHMFNPRKDETKLTMQPTTSPIDIIDTTPPGGEVITASFPVSTEQHDDVLTDGNFPVCRRNNIEEHVQACEEVPSQGTEHPSGKSTVKEVNDAIAWVRSLNPSNYLRCL